MDIASGIYGQLYQLVLDEDLAWYCTAHWLSCLYSDYLYERVAGEQFPCGTCERKKECTVENKTSHSAGQVQFFNHNDSTFPAQFG